MFIRLVVFGAGAVLMAVEVLAFRMVGKTFGTALRETTAVIAVFLTAMSIGYWLGGRAGDRWPSRATLGVPLGLAAGWILLLPWLDRPLSDAVATSSLPFATHALVVCLGLFLVPTVLLAAASPVAIRLLARDLTRTGRTAGGIAAISTMGSIAGTILTGFWLIGTWPISGILRGLAVLTLAFGGLAMIRRGSTRAAPILIVGLLLGALPLERCDARVVYSHDSAYHNIVVEDRGRYRHLLFDDTRQSRMLIAEPHLGGYEYTRLFHTVWLFRDEIDTALFIGLGGGTGPKQFLVDYPDVGIIVAEVDPAVIEVARTHFGLPEDGPRLDVREVDGRVALQRQRELVDVIVVDAYTSGRYGASIPFHVTTREFFELAASRLSDDGILVYNVIEQISRAGDDFLRALVRTMNTVFAEVYLFECQTSTNTVVVALRVAAALDMPALLDRAGERMESGRVPREDLGELAAGVYDGEIITEDVPMLTDDYAPVERLLGR